MYDVAKNPKDKKWYVIGSIGSRYWMPISSPCNTKQEALKRLHRQRQADKDALNCIKELPII